MSTALPPIRRVLTIGLVLCTGCDSSAKPEILTRMSGDRTRVTQPPTEILVPVAEVIPPDYMHWTFRMGAAVSLAASGPPDCRLVVADATDRAIHWFKGVPPEYVKTLYLGGREGILTRMSAMSVSADGRFVIADSRRRLVATVAEDSVVSVAAFRASESDVDVPLLDVAIGSNSRIFEAYAVLPSLGATPTPPVRIWRSQGSLEGYAGERLFLDQPFWSNYASAGAIEFSRDTLWMARYFDARLLAFRPEPGSVVPLRSIELPLYFDGGAATSTMLGDAGGGGVLVSAPRHLDEFAIDPDDNFFVEHLRPDGPSLLGAVSRSGEYAGAWSIGEVDIRAMAATRNLLYVAIRSADSRRTRIWAFRNPLSSVGSPEAMC